MIGDTNYGTFAVRYGVPSELDTEDPQPAKGEFILAYDGTSPILKIGDGVRSWSELPNLVGGVGGGGAYVEATTAPVGAADGTIWYDTSPAV
jgi:hypothetical protein